MRNGSLDSISAPDAVENSARDVDNSEPLDPLLQRISPSLRKTARVGYCFVRDLRCRGRFRHDYEGGRWQAIGRVPEAPAPSHLHHISA